MKYKVYRESKLPDVDMDLIRKTLRKPIDAHKHRKDPIYFDEDDLWFWHNDSRKRVAFSDIEKIEKAAMHGFGKMIKITYRHRKGPIENDKPVDVHLLDVSMLPESPKEIAAKLQQCINEVRKNEVKSRPIRQFKND